MAIFLDYKSLVGDIMSMQDPIADLLTRIRNGQAAHATQVELPASKVKLAILQVFKDEGYIEGFRLVEESSKKPKVLVELKYHNGKGVINKVARASRPGLRLYFEAAKIPKILGGFGVGVVSTSKGVMSDAKARSVGIGGELLCTVE